MSARKFAAITGSLLVRKGEAGASAGMQLRDAVIRTERRQQEPWIDRAPQPPAAPREPAKAKPNADHAARHRIALRLTDDQFRRLGIAAARMHRTTQDFLIEALEAHVAVLAENELAGCRCLRAEGSCGETEAPGTFCETMMSNRAGD